MLTRSDKAIRIRLSAVDWRAITPLIWENVNPYGRFKLDLDTRIALN